MRKKYAIGVLIIAVACIIATASVASPRAPRLIRDEEIEHILQTMCKPVFEQAGVSPSTVRFILVEDSTLNAFVAGGQNIFINTGLIMKTQNPEELIGVIAHETGHIALGHLFRLQENVDNLSFQSILSSVLGVAVAFGTGSGEAGMAVASVGQSTALRNILTHTRTQESSADEAGVRFLHGSRMTAKGMLTFMQKLGDQELLPASQQSEYVRTHPLTQDRIDYLQNATQNEGAVSGAPAAITQLHNRMKAKLTGYLYPDRALQDKSTSPDATYARAIAFYRKGQTDRALPLIDSLLKAEPQNAYLHELKGQVLFEGGRVNDAAPSYARAVALAPQSSLIRTAYGHVLVEKKPESRLNLEDAVKQFQLSLNNDPRQPDAHRFMAVAYGKLGNEGQLRLHLAEEYLLQNDIPAAKKAADLALHSLPKNSAGALRAQDVLDLAKKKEKAQKKD